MTEGSDDATILIATSWQALKTLGTKAIVRASAIAQLLLSSLLFS